MITIWGGATARTLRPHWMLCELGVEYEPKLIGSRTGETQSEAFVKLNVKEKIPVLVDDHLVLTESAAIVTYLGDTYGPDTGLVPKPYTPQRAKYNEWSSYVQMELDAHTLYVIRKHRDLASLYGDAPAAVDAAIEGFTKQLRFADQGLDGREYLVGDAFTGADILLTSCLTWASAYGVEISDTLQAYADRNTERDAFKRAAKLNFSISPGG
ncbi:MAG: glutathione S-transferase family protein [Gammaproteobacteria bacterium]|nr:glutathione S-transferase family protein [Gammaproteobacteria bacterium]